MKIIERQYCTLKGEDGLEALHTLRAFPVFMGCVETPVSDDIKADMVWHICRVCGLIQLKNLIPLGILYPQSHGAGCVGKIWNEHHQSFARFISQFKPRAVLEIGGAHGILSQEYQSFDPIPWTILEPNPTPVKGVRARFIKGFFDEHFSFNEPFDTVIHSHVFEHIYELAAFMRHLSVFMSQGQQMIFSVPNMKVMLEKKFTNCLNFEHTVFLIEPYIEYLLSVYGFRLVKKEYFMEDHSIFYSAFRDSPCPLFDLPPNLYAHNKSLYLEHVQYHEQLIRKLNQEINNAQQDVFIFGAHVFSQYLLAFGLDEAKIVGILDNDPNKHGKRLYGTNLKVSSPQILSGLKHPTIILKSGVYNSEIKKDILERINKDVVFLE